MNDFLALSRRLHTACEKLGISPWIPGSKVIHFQDGLLSGRRRVPDCQVGWNTNPGSEYWLDLSDGLTATGVLLLARQAWRDETLFVQRFGESRHWWEVQLAQAYGAGRRYAMGDSETEALVITIEARAAIVSEKTKGETK